jgi:PAS domain S-box-containing protein
VRLAGLNHNRPVTVSRRPEPSPSVEEQSEARSAFSANWLAIGGLLIAYFLAGKCGLRFASLQSNVSAVWPPTGISLAGCLLFGYGVWPAILLGAFAVNMTTAGTVATSLGIAAGNTLEALASAYLVNRFANGRAVFNRPQDIFKFTVLAAFASTAFAATVGAASLSFGGYVSEAQFGQVWFTWWMGDMVGDLVFAPLVLLWCAHPRLEWNRAQLYEATLMLVSLVVVAAVVFGGILPADIQRHPIDFLCIPVLIWAAYRFGPRETATASFVLSAIAIVGTLHGFGPFAGNVANTALLLLQAFLGVLAITAIAFAANVAQRRTLDEARSGLAAIVDSSDDAIIGKTLDGRITSWNAGAERLFGYTMEEAVGQPISIIIPPERLEEEARALERLYRARAVELPDTVRLRKDGLRVPISLAVSPVKDVDGRVIGASVIARDISEHKRMIEALRTSEEKFHEMAETVPDILFTNSTDGKTEYTNQRFYDYTGMPNGSAEGVGWMAALHPKDAKSAEEAMPRLVRKGQSFELEYRLRAADGTYRWFLARTRPIRDSYGRIIKWFGSSTEIEEHKRAQQEREELLRAEQIARAEAEAAASKLRRLQSVTDSALPELTLDQMLRELLVRLRSAVQGDTASVLLLAPSGDELVPVASVGLEEEVEAGITVPLGHGIAGRIATSDGGLIFNDVSEVEMVNSLIRQRISSLVGAPLKVEESVIGVIHVGSVKPREFSEEHLELIQLVAHRAALAIERTRLHGNERAARATAEEANRAKDEFLAMLGHELRNPLGAILSSMEILEHFGTDAQQAGRARQIMSRQLRHLARLVDDLLDVARVTMGKVELHRQVLDIAETVKACVNALDKRLSSYDVKVETEPVWVSGDPTRLEQIVNNLLRNAIEYTPAGGRIRVSVKADDTGAVLRVEDNGVGISADLLARVFDLFVQDQRGLDRPGGGLGIGLTLTKRLVELHGGKVEVSSPGPGLGSVFTVRLPGLEVPPLQPEPSSTVIRANVRRRVLIVEDNADARESLRTILELSGHEIYEAGDGPGGVEQALELRPDMALIDIGLPSLDGYEVAKQIRSAPAGREMFLVALTGYGQPRDRQMAREAGFDAHLVKPVDFKRLSEIIALSAK